MFSFFVLFINFHSPPPPPIFISSENVRFQFETVQNLSPDHAWVHIINSFPRLLILDSSKLKKFVGDNFKFVENGRTFSNRLENIVRTGEIARYEQFLLFPQYCLKTSIAYTYKPGLV